MANTKQAFAEIIESSLQGFTAQSWKWDNFPNFGSLVAIESDKRTIIAIVHQVKTGSMDPTRYPFPYQKTEEELLKEQPQIFEFLKTTFNGLTLGYYEKGKLYYLLSPQPPKIHAFVVPLNTDIARQFFSCEYYLHTIFGAGSAIFNSDELLLALLKQLHADQLLTEERVTAFIQTYSLLTGNDYRRLKLFLMRAQSLLQLPATTPKIEPEFTSKQPFL